ncbi:glycosyl transferase family 8 [Asticcacaulis sp. DW145]|uniref:glycosyltransferase family 8 protein n=1 Tax=Asticcacaulis sp. DW145 TaxID=3095608 RepID=UPI0030880965|nr:glycosyl transferase family 8 [Asticcacaulis sp. DW145]
MSSSKKSCVCYAVDDNYLFPTLLSASQVRQYNKSRDTDVVIICIAAPSEKTKLAAEVARELGISFIVKPLSAIDNMHPMFGRLFLNDLLPELYERTVYIDGDTQVVGSLEPLIEAEIPTGHFLAARDPAALFAKLSPAWYRTISSDRLDAGITGSLDDYFNTGLLVFDLSSWRQLSQATLETFRKKEGGYKFGDQDPMNVAVGDKCIYIPNTWNFPGFLIGTPAEDRAQPIVYHFMSNPRPWTHTGKPWGAAWSKPYQKFITRFPALSSIAPRSTLFQKLKYKLQQRLKLNTEYARVGTLLEAKPTLCVAKTYRAGTQN